MIKWAAALMMKWQSWMSKLVQIGEQIIYDLVWKLCSMNRIDRYKQEAVKFDY